MTELKEYLKTQTHEQLETFILNDKQEIEYLGYRLFLLSGCKDYGNSDSLNGKCIDCYNNNKELFERCHAFENMMKSFNNKSNISFLEKGQSK